MQLTAEDATNSFPFLKAQFTHTARVFHQCHLCHTFQMPRQATRAPSNGTPLHLSSVFRHWGSEEAMLTLIATLQQLTTGVLKVMINVKSVLIWAA